MDKNAPYRQLSGGSYKGQRRCKVSQAEIEEGRERARCFRDVIARHYVLRHSRHVNMAQDPLCGINVVVVEDTLRRPKSS